MFSKLGLADNILSAVKDAGYTEPTPVQVRVIPEILQNKDVIGCAQTGTGKTASFILPIIHKLSKSRTRARMPRALILEPTRELAIQVADTFLSLGKNSNLKHALLIGGHSLVAQEKELAKNVDVLIATPGRLLDLIERGKVLLLGTELLVIDEADRMMDMGFMPEVQAIVSRLSQKRQTLLFSATMPPEIKDLSKTLLKDPTEIMVSPPAQTAKTINQYYAKTTSKNKGQRLRQVFSDQSFETMIVFMNRKRAATSLFVSLLRDKRPVGLLHGDLTQAKRTETLSAFKKGEIKILIASNVAARGIDVESLDCVINYDVPLNPEDYVHRIGRTGRAGQSGTAITFVSKEDVNAWEQIQKIVKEDIKEYVWPQQIPKPQSPKPKPKPQKTTPQKKGELLGFGDHTPAFMKNSLPTLS
ncbi:MAG: DEAD/DEAH box helicase [Pseudomonadota bacterium]